MKLDVKLGRDSYPILIARACSRRQASIWSWRAGCWW